MRRNGHYSYTGLPTTWFPHPPPLSVKNANLVRRWLEDSFGLTLSENKSDMITIHALPKFTEDDVRQRIGLEPIGQGELLEDRSRKYTSGVLAEPRRQIDAETGVRPTETEAMPLHGYSHPEFCLCFLHTRILLASGYDAFFITVPHPHGHWQLQQLLGNYLTINVQMCLDIPDSDKPEFTINQTIFTQRNPVLRLSCASLNHNLQ